MKKHLLTYAFLLATAVTAFAQEDVLQIFDEYYTPMPWSEVDNITFDLSEQLLMLQDTEGYFHKISLKDLEKNGLISGPTLPVIQVNTTPYQKEVTSKDIYLSGTFDLLGFGQYKDISTDVQIRGRGNSSWTQFPKKPYRLKFSSKQSLCGLTKAKNYVLLANYTDPSFLQFALATKIAKMLDMPFTNTVVPVDVVFNGIYKGTYLLTNKPGINAGSVDIDETTSIMWELDVNFDEPNKFYSNYYRSPVMQVDPDMDYSTFLNWKDDYNRMEEAVIQSRASEVIDLDLYARYILIHEMLGNNEPGHPKSVKLYKEKAADKYQFGPIWDFDCAFGHFWDTHTNYTTDEINFPSNKTSFMKDLNSDPETVEAINKYWDQLKDKLPEFFEYIDEMAEVVRNSAYRNKAVWPAIDDFDKSIVKLKNWLTLRYQAMPNIIKNEYVARKK